ncbi:MULTISPECIES: hypothetical protein [unclassified Lysobacter]|uniref:hypothetical protein n=1 Tax=unclassified Lysobacter TaxID=2635362 RepID=UPI000A6D9C5E|nr:MULTISPECIES: hypothetical protein [unclassified Lysobacter]
MNYTVYRGATGIYLLVPDCMKASREAERLHGPLVHCGAVESEGHPLPHLWEAVLTEVDERLYAVLSEHIAHSFLGIECGNTAVRAPRDDSHP